jgi:hypothetical protein
MGLHFQTNIMAKSYDLKSISKYVPSVLKFLRMFYAFIVQLEGQIMSKLKA